MTRLVKEWIKTMEQELSEYECELKKKTNFDLCALGAKASGCNLSLLKECAKQMRVAVVPMTVGLGTIDFFGQSVAGILKAMGFDAYVTQNTDVSGIDEAYEKESHIVFMADDERFLAINLHKKQIGENNWATACGYVTALEAMAGTLDQRQVLLLGYGTLGALVLRLLRCKGAQVCVYDKDESRLRLIKDDSVKMIRDKNEIAKYSLIVDATSQGEWLHKDMLHDDLWMVAPGIPLSLDEAAAAAYENRVLHDKLQIGVATMIGFTVKD